MKSWLIHPIEAKKSTKLSKRRRRNKIEIKILKFQVSNSNRTIHQGTKFHLFEGGRACCCLIMKYYYRDQSLDIRHYFMKLLPNHVKMNLFGISKQRKMNE